MSKKFIIFLMSFAIILLILWILINNPFKKEFLTDAAGPYGKAFNKNRLELGIPVIGEKWFVKYQDQKKCIWKPKIETLDFPYHQEKVTNIDRSNKIISEEDTYFKPEANGKEYMLLLKYSFIDNYGTWCSVLTTYNKVNKYGVKNIVEPIQDTISLAEADSVLFSWKLNRMITQ